LRYNILFLRLFCYAVISISSKSDAVTLYGYYAVHNVVAFVAE
jgi:hypothetical protein